MSWNRFITSIKFVDLVDRERSETWKRHGTDTYTVINR